MFSLRVSACSCLHWHDISWHDATCLDAQAWPVLLVSAEQCVPLLTEAGLWLKIL